MGRIRFAVWGAFLALTLAACGGGGGDSGEPPGPQPPTPPATSPPPGIVSFTPTAGSAGTQVVISGLNFALTVGGNTVSFGGVNATVMSASATSLVVVVPAGAISGTLQVTTIGGTSTSSASFTVLVSSGPGANWQTRTFGSHVTTPVAAAIAYNGTRYVSVGSGAYEASTDAKIWTRTLDLVSGDDVAWNGQLFVTVRSSFFLHTSPDGLTWTARSLPSGSTASLNAVAASASMWVAVGRSGAIVSSPDGITWTVRTSGTAKDLADVTWTGSGFVAVGVEGAVVTSTDGVSWTLQPAPTTDSLRAVAGSSSLIVAATVLELLTSTDAGVSWAAAPASAAFNEIIHADGRFLAVGFSETATSIDGVVWQASAQIPSIFDSVVHDGARYVAIGSDWNTVGSTLTSPDGLDWTIVQSAHSLRRVAQSAADGRLVGVGNSHMVRTSTDGGATWTFAPITNNISLNLPFLDLVWAPSAGAFIGHVIVAANQDAYSSVDGATWTKLGDMPCHGALAASPTRMVNVGSTSVGSCISVSDDGTSWAQVTSPSSSNFSGVFWTGSQFVATGSNGLIATSADGLAWAVRASGVSTTLNGGTVSGSIILVVGSSGTILTSGDGGVTWTPRTSGTTATLRDVVFTGSEFFAVGSGGTLLRSTTGQSWSSQATPYTVNFGDILWLSGSSKLLIGGERGLIATSP
jgi:hypothetical protein